MNPNEGHKQAVRVTSSASETRKKYDRVRYGVENLPPDIAAARAHIETLRLDIASITSILENFNPAWHPSLEVAKGFRARKEMRRAYCRQEISFLEAWITLKEGSDRASGAVGLKSVPRVPALRPLTEPLSPDHPVFRLVRSKMTESKIEVRLAEITALPVPGRVEEALGRICALSSLRKEISEMINSLAGIRNDYHDLSKTAFKKAVRPLASINSFVEHSIGTLNDFVKQNGGHISVKSMGLVLCELVNLIERLVRMRGQKKTGESKLTIEEHALIADAKRMLALQDIRFGTAGISSSNTTP